jgi:hypothetical protein
MLATRIAERVKINKTMSTPPTQQCVDKGGFSSHLEAEKLGRRPLLLLLLLLAISHLIPHSKPLSLECWVSSMQIVGFSRVFGSSLLLKLPPKELTSLQSSEGKNPNSSLASIPIPLQKSSCGELFSIPSSEEIPILPPPLPTLALEVLISSDRKPVVLQEEQRSQKGKISSATSQRKG